MLQGSSIIERLRQWVPQLGQALARAVRAMAASVTALVKSPAVWLACALVFVAGYSTAHGIRGITIAKVKAERDRLMIAARALDARVVERDGEIAHLRGLNAALEAKLAASAPRTAAGTPPPVTKVKKGTK